MGSAFSAFNNLGNLLFAQKQVPVGQHDRFWYSFGTVDTGANERPATHRNFANGVSLTFRDLSSTDFRQ